MSFPMVIQGSEGMQYEHSSAKKHPFGLQMYFLDGRKFEYGQAGAAALAVGRLMQQAVVTSGHTKDLVVAAAVAAGGTTVTFTNTTTAITADMYAEGFMFVNDEAGEGYIYRIKSNLAESTGTGVATIVLEEGSGVRIALTTSSEIGLRKHLCDEVIVAPTTITGVLAGATVRAVDKNYYCWLQVKGAANVLTNGTVVRGEPVTRSVTTAGAVDPYNEDGTGNLMPIGHVESVSSSTEYSLIDLDIR